MAIWQYVTYLVPAKSVGPDGPLPGIVRRPDYSEMPRFVFPFSTTEFERHAADYLPPAKSWSDAIRIWGDEEKDDLLLVTKGEQVIEIRARLDLRDLSIERVRLLLRLAESLQCSFVEARKGEVFAASEDSLVKSIRSSAPAEFVIDPRGFLERLAKSVGKR